MSAVCCMFVVCLLCVLFVRCLFDVCVWLFAWLCVRCLFVVCVLLARCVCWLLVGCMLCDWCSFVVDLLSFVRFMCLLFAV